VPVLELLENELVSHGAWLFQFHGWWYVMTAIAAYDVMESIRACSEKNQLKAVYLALVNRVGE